MKLKIIRSFLLPFVCLLLDIIFIDYHGVHLIHLTFLSLVLAGLNTQRYLLITPLISLIYLSFLFYDSLFFIPLFSLPLISIMHFSARYFRSQIVTGTLFYSIYLALFLWVIPFFTLNTNPFTLYTFLAFTGNLIGASLSLKLLPIVE